MSAWKQKEGREVHNIHEIQMNFKYHNSYFRYEHQAQRCRCTKYYKY